MEWYYKKKNADYLTMPPFREDCRQSTDHALAFIYPKSGALIYRAKSFEGELQPIVCKVAHRNPDAELFWYLNDRFLGSTQRFHEFPVEAPIGKHVITVVDENGNDARCSISVE
jgi:penicillin-binding protein 1C